jgi:hypothetical protein
MCCEAAHTGADEELIFSELHIAEETHSNELELGNEPVAAACEQAEAEGVSTLEARLKAVEERLRALEFRAE